MDSSIIPLVCGIGFIAIFFLVGSFMVFSGIRKRRKATASLSWPKVTGNVSKTFIEESTDTDEDGITTTSYTPKVTYTYQVGAQTYSSERVSFGYTTSYGRQKKAQEKLDLYPLNSQLAVYYDPENPAESTLQPSAKGTLVGIIIGIILMVSSACIGCPLLAASALGYL